MSLETQEPKQPLLQRLSARTREIGQEAMALWRDTPGERIMMAGYGVAAELGVLSLIYRMTGLTPADKILAGGAILAGGLAMSGVVKAVYERAVVPGVAAIKNSSLFRTK